jgi:hypothetical protein
MKIFDISRGRCGEPTVASLQRPARKRLVIDGAFRQAASDQLDNRRLRIATHEEKGTRTGRL